MTRKRTPKRGGKQKFCKIGIQVEIPVSSRGGKKNSNWIQRSNFRSLVITFLFEKLPFRYPPSPSLSPSSPSVFCRFSLCNDASTTGIKLIKPCSSLKRIMGEGGGEEGERNDRKRYNLSIGFFPPLFLLPNTFGWIETSWIIIETTGHHPPTGFGRGYNYYHLQYRLLVTYSFIAVEGGGRGARLDVTQYCIVDIVHGVQLM